MKPSILAALVFRLVAVWWVWTALCALIFPFLMGKAHLYAMPSAGSLESFRSPLGVFGGFGALALVFGLISVGAAVLLFIWSAPLGRLTARGLE